MIYRYGIDRGDRIAWVSDEWLGFARDNDAPELTREWVIGKSLFSFIAGWETEHLHRLLIDRVRSTGEPASVSLRCDAPSLRRAMRLQLSPGAVGAVELEGRVLWQEARAPVLLFDASAKRSDEIVSVCGWCRRVLGDGEWLEVEAAIDRLSLFQLPRLPRLSQSNCPDCVGDVRQVAAGGIAG